MSEITTGSGLKVYFYKCVRCEHVWHEALPYEDRCLPMKDGCPSCHAKTGIMRALDPPYFKKGKKQLEKEAADAAV